MTKQWMGLRNLAWAALGVLLALSVAGSAQAGKLRVLYSFCSLKNCADGRLPGAGLVADAAGNLYGTTTAGGSTGFGTVFELVRTTHGGFRFKTLYSFCSENCYDGSNENPLGHLIVDIHGNLYGMTSQSVFQLSPGGRKGHAWTETLLSKVCPQFFDCTAGGLTYAGAASGAPYDGASALYGVTDGGGGYNSGSVFSLTPKSGKWTTKEIYTFCSRNPPCLDGAQPMSGLLLDQNGNLFGATRAGGGNNYANNTFGSGVVFELSPNGDSWTETVLHSFCSDAHRCRDGGGPYGHLTWDADGNLLGTALFGGGTRCPSVSGCGVLFKLVPNGEASEETVLYPFCGKHDCVDGREPWGRIVLNAEGQMFGVTEYGGVGGGVVFKFDGASLKVLHTFCAPGDCADGESPTDGPLMDTSGNIFGTTLVGGAFHYGTVFMLRP
jgi:uncharacterized repeat protein (TIGR03803 family)